MSTHPGPSQIRLWSEEVARNPDTLAFLPLAEVYRAEGRHDAALRLCLRGLERHPTHVGAHHLLGVLYRESGDLVKAFDEWDIALRLDPEHAGARREIGLVSVQRREWATAVRHLERAVQADPGDDEVREALGVARGRLEPATSTAASAPPASAAGPARPGPGGSADWQSAQDGFTALVGERGVIGAVLLDAQGYVLAGRMEVSGRDRSAEVAAALQGASSEAERALRHLGLGGWEGILLESPQSILRIEPVGDSMVAVASDRNVPTGWVLRVAARASALARRLLDGGAP